MQTPLQHRLLFLACGDVFTSSRKTRKVTFLSSVATSVPSLVKSWRPLGAWLGHFCRLGLYLSSVVSVQLLDKALRYLQFIQHDTDEHLTSVRTEAQTHATAESRVAG